MVASTAITDYFGAGTHAARPTSPNVPTGCTAIYYETDTTFTFVWSGSAWVQVAGGGGGGGGTPAIVQNGAAAGSSITGVTLGSAPIPGNLLIAIVCHGLPTPGSGWTTFDGDPGGATETTMLFKVAGGSESATQNPCASAGLFTIMMYEVSDCVPTMNTIGRVSDAVGTTHTVSPIAMKSTGFFIGMVMSESTADLPISFTSGVTGDATAVNGSSESVQGFHAAISTVGATSITATYTPSINCRMVAYAFS